MIQRVNCRKCILYISIPAFLNVILISVNAQSFIGYHSSPYAGVYSTVTSPADILNHRVRADLNLVGFNTELGSNFLKFNFKKKSGDFYSFPDSLSYRGKFNLSTEVFGPSLLVKWNDRNAIAITTRMRLMTNAYGLSPLILNTFLGANTGGDSVGTVIKFGSMSINAHAWKEVALTYSRQIGNTDFGVWKAGVSVKLMEGIAAMSFNTNNLSYRYDTLSNPTGRDAKDILANIRGNVLLSYTRNLDSVNQIFPDLLKFFHPSIGFDLGVSYEFRDEMQVYETQYSDRTANYIWKLGASITDIGFIRYSKNKLNGIYLNGKGKTVAADDLSVPSDSSGIKKSLNYFATLFNAGTEPSAMYMQLPTALHITYDRNFNKWLGVQAQFNVPLVFTKLSAYNGNYYPTSFSVTARAETPQAGLYLPFSYNSISGYRMGAALRMGPLVIGSASLFSAGLSKTKALDLYFILRAPLFSYRPYREKKPKNRIHLSAKERRHLRCPSVY